MRDKGAAFRKLAATRTESILERIRILGNCSNTNNYLYKEEDIEKIFNAIRKELEITEMKFRGNLNKRSEFTL